MTHRGDFTVGLYEHVPHPRIKTRQAEGPVKVIDQLPGKHGNPATRFNSAVALAITRGVGTMWCAYAFAALALISLPDAIREGRQAVISWIAQTFLQLVLLSIILVGQAILSKTSDARSEQTFADAEAILHECIELQKHLQAQDELLVRQQQRLTALVLASEKRKM